MKPEDEILENESGDIDFQKKGIYIPLTFIIRFIWITFIIRFIWKWFSKHIGGSKDV